MSGWVSRISWRMSGARRVGGIRLNATCLGFRVWVWGLSEVAGVPTKGLYLISLYPFMLSRISGFGVEI